MTLDLIIVGGGLTGLSAARAALSRGMNFQLVEASDTLGGRVATDLVDGFRIDRGFQILLTSYPELIRLGVLDRLDLRRFEPGSLVRIESKGRARFRRAADPWRRPAQSLDLDWRHVFGMSDALKLARLRASIDKVDPEAANRSTFEYLERRGFSADTLQRFFVPFLGGVLLDRTLSAPAPFMRRLFACFSRGDAAVPALGMSALPEAIAAPIPKDRIRLGTRVVGLSEGMTTLSDGQHLQAKHIVLATDGEVARTLCPDLGLPALRWHQTTSCYFACKGPLPSPLDTPYLVLDGDNGSLHHLAPLSTIAPEYAPAGHSLLVASHDGVADPDLASRLETELRRWFPATSWQLIASRPIPQALPIMPTDTGTKVLRPQPWLTVAGDHIADRSIDGALASGREAVEALP
jgi:phytoene dehydrogenase-like protein